MEQSPSFVAQGQCAKVCRLKKSFYGLKQSPEPDLHTLHQ